MTKPQNNLSFIEMFPHPVFCVKEGIITEVNEAASCKQIRTGDKILDYITCGKDEYLSYSGLCLSVTLTAENCAYIASVFRNGEYDIFHIQSDYADPDLRALALAAQQLRGPLANAMISTDQLFPNKISDLNESSQQWVNQINQSLYQLLRTINNMADGSNSQRFSSANLETVNIVSVIDELMARAEPLAQKSGRTLCYKPIHQDIYCPADRSVLERGLLNMLSNAIKYSPAGSTVNVILAHNGSKLSIAVDNRCEDSKRRNVSHIFSRYQRDPGIEDGRNGLGLGIRLIQTTAAVHSGTLLIDCPKDNEIRFTMTVSTKNDRPLSLRTPVTKVLSGGYDNVLIELSDVLPSSAYDDVN